MGLTEIALHRGEPLTHVHTQAKLVEYNIKYSFKPISMALTLSSPDCPLSPPLPPASSFSELDFTLQVTGFTSTLTFSLRYQVHLLPPWKTKVGGALAQAYSNGP